MCTSQKTSLLDGAGPSFWKERGYFEDGQWWDDFPPNFASSSGQFFVHDLKPLIQMGVPSPPSIQQRLANLELQVAVAKAKLAPPFVAPPPSIPGFLRLLAQPKAGWTRHSPPAFEEGVGQVVEDVVRAPITLSHRSSPQAIVAEGGWPEEEIIVFEGILDPDLSEPTALWPQKRDQTPVKGVKGPPPWIGMGRHL